MTMPHLTEKQLNAFADSWRGKSKHRALWTKAESAARALNDFEEVLGDFYVETSNARLDANEFNVAMGEEAIPDGEEGHPRYHQTHPLRIDQYNNTLILVCNWCEEQLWADRLEEQEEEEEKLDYYSELYDQIKKDLTREQIYFEDIYTGGNISVLEIGEPEGPNVWVDYWGSVTLYQDPEERGDDFEVLFDSDATLTTREAMQDFSRKAVKAIDDAIRAGKIENVWREN